MQDMTKMSKNPKFLRSREYGLWINTRWSIDRLKTCALTTICRFIKKNVNVELRRLICFINISRECLM